MTEPHPRTTGLPVAASAELRAAVRELLRPRRGLALAAAAVLTAATAVGLLTQPLLGRAVDIVAEGRPAGDLTELALLLVAVALVQGGALAYGLALVSRLGETTLARLRERFVDRALSLPLDQLERAGSGDLTARVTGDVTLVAQAVRNALPAIARSALAIALTLGALALLDWRFLLAALVGVPIQAHTARWYPRHAMPLYARQRVAVAGLQQRLLETIGGARTVRAFRHETRHAERVERGSLAALDLTMREVRLVISLYSRLHLAEFVGLAAVLVTGYLLVRDGSASVGTATAAALYFHSLFTPINAALFLMDDAQSAQAGLARIVGVAHHPLPEPAAGAEHAAPTEDPGRVTVTMLDHAYEPGQPVLHEVDLALRPKERVALVGASGAGKSTLAKLIAGVHRPTAGRISRGGAVGLVTQEVHVFAGPLAEDLRLARPDATEAELRAALDLVDALDWAEALPGGLDTVVGAGGHRLTAAQAQQLALARLVLADPAIAVLDEATAEAGSTGARSLEHAADRALDGRTALVVAHRLTQAATADRIVVMADGRIVESGTHDELRAARGRYAALWDAWSDHRHTTH